MGNCWPKPIENSTVRPSSPPPPHSSSRAVADHRKHYKNVINHDGIGKQSSSSSSDHNNNSNNMNGDHCRGGGAADDGGGAGNEEKKLLKEYTMAELRSATRNFRPDTVLGEGGFGRVFKGWIDEKTLAPSKVGFGIPVAVKKSSADSEQGFKEWQAEVELLGKLRHPNLVKLLGYCSEDKQFLLVYEYMPKGSLASHLFRKGVGETIPWDTRIKIAIGAAEGAAFLHASNKKLVIYRDFKAANILLDKDFNAKLSDFGLAKLGPTDGNSHVTTKVVGTYGYAAPEYMATGHLYVKSDVYGFGVVLLEIITGLPVLDLNRPGPETNLVEWAKPMLPHMRKLKKIIDPNLNGHYPSKAAFKMAELIVSCLDPDLRCRPTMREVCETLKQIRLIEMNSNESKQVGRDGNGHHEWTPQRTYHGSSDRLRPDGGRPKPHSSSKAPRSY